ncbi:hypothetical protein ACFQ7B_43105 [Streptomyces erythrochromogenes]
MTFPQALSPVQKNALAQLREADNGGTREIVLHFSSVNRKSEHS